MPWSATVVSQSPTAGSKVAKGSAVDLVISGGPAKVAVPELKGLTRSEAVKALSDAGLTSVETAEYDSSVAKGTVIDQLPAAGEKVVPGSAVGVLVSLGARPIPPVAVPDVRGKREAEARTILRDAGLNPAFVTGNNPTVPVGAVVEQTPVAGVKVAPDTEVLVLVSAGVAPPTAVAVPNVVGKQTGAARSALEKQGLKGRAFQTYSAKPKGEVISQDRSLAQALRQAPWWDCWCRPAPRRPSRRRIPRPIRSLRSIPRSRLSLRSIPRNRLSLRSLRPCKCPTSPGLPRRRRAPLCSTKGSRRS